MNELSATPDSMATETTLDFDAITGAFDRIDFHGVDGVSLKKKWQDGPQTFLGILVDGFPNLLMVMGPL